MVQGNKLLNKKYCKIIIGKLGNKIKIKIKNEIIQLNLC